MSSNDLLIEFAAAQRSLDDHNILYSKPLHESVKSMLSSPEATEIFMVFRHYIETTLVMHEAGKRLSQDVSGFSRAHLNFEDACELLDIAVYGPNYRLI
jgi:hypothetical protein